MTKSAWLAIGAVSLLGVSAWYLTRQLTTTRDGSELMIIRRPFKEIAVYPDIHVNDRINDARGKLKSVGIPYREIGQGLAYDMRGRILGMTEDAPMTILLISDRGRIITLGVNAEVPANHLAQSVKLYDKWNSKLEDLLGPSTPNEADRQVRRAHWHDADNYSPTLVCHFISFGGWWGVSLTFFSTAEGN